MRVLPARVEHRAPRERHHVELRAHGRNDARMPVAQREHAVAAGEIERAEGIVRGPDREDARREPPVGRRR